MAAFHRKAAILSAGDTTTPHNLPKVYSCKRNEISIILELRGLICKFVDTSVVQQLCKIYYYQVIVHHYKGHEPKYQGSMKIM